MRRGRSAAGTLERMLTGDGLAAVAMEYAQVEVGAEAAKKLAAAFGELVKNADFRNPFVSWQTSLGPVAWLKNRLHDLGVLGAAGAHDDAWEEVIRVQGRAGGYADLTEYARSKVFRTAVIPRPIDLVSGRVAGLPWCLNVRRAQP